MWVKWQKLVMRWLSVHVACLIQMHLRVCMQDWMARHQQAVHSWAAAGALEEQTLSFAQMAQAAAATGQAGGGSGMLMEGSAMAAVGL